MVSPDIFIQFCIMEKLDLTKQFKEYYKATAKPALLTLAPANYLSITGKGDPSGDAFAADIQAIYPLAYTIKFMCKEQGNDFVVPKLEADWWYDETRYKDITAEQAPTSIPRSEWLYRLLIRMPDFVSPEMAASAIETVVNKKGIHGSAKVEWYSTPQQKVVQALHTGPYSTEPETIKRIIDFMQQNNLAKGGHHHEVYLSDFRKTAPEKLKTILREPVA